MRIASSASPALVILNQIQKSYSLQFLQTRIQHCLLVLCYFHDSPQKTIYFPAAFFAFFILGHIVQTVNSVIRTNLGDFE